MTFPLSQVLGFFCTFLYGSFFEWTLHTYLMHQRRWQYPFRAHAVVHHGLFRTGPQYSLSDAKVIRKVRCACWNAPMILILHSPPRLYMQYLFVSNISVRA